MKVFKNMINKIHKYLQKRMMGGNLDVLKHRMGLLYLINCQETVLEKTIETRLLTNKQTYTILSRLDDSIHTEVIRARDDYASLNETLSIFMGDTLFQYKITKHLCDCGHGHSLTYNKFIKCVEYILNMGYCDWVVCKLWCPSLFHTPRIYEYLHLMRTTPNVIEHFDNLLKFLTICIVSIPDIKKNVGVEKIKLLVDWIKLLPNEETVASISEWVNKGPLRTKEIN